MSRSARLSARRLSVHTVDLHDFEDTVIEEQDEAVLTVGTQLTLSCQQYVVHSATYQVPVFYFSVHKSGMYRHYSYQRWSFLNTAPDGQVLALTDIMSTTLFRPLALPDANTAHGITAPSAAFAMLSQGDHPTLGIPCWYLHPCHTAEVVGEILKELIIDDKGRSQRYLEAWFMVLGNMITWS